MSREKPKRQQNGQGTLACSLGTSCQHSQLLLGTMGELRRTAWLLCFWQPGSSRDPQSEKPQIPPSGSQPSSLTRIANTFQLMLICCSLFCKQRLIKHLLRQGGSGRDAHILKMCCLLLVCWISAAHKMNWDRSCIWLSSRFPLCGLGTNPVQFQTVWIYAYDLKIDWI